MWGGWIWNDVRIKYLSISSILGRKSDWRCRREATQKHTSLSLIFATPWTSASITHPGNQTGVRRWGFGGSKPSIGNTAASNDCSSFSPDKAAAIMPTSLCASSGDLLKGKAGKHIGSCSCCCSEETAHLWDYKTGRETCSELNKPCMSARCVSWAGRDVYIAAFRPRRAQRRAGQQADRLFGFEVIDK